MNQSEKIDSIYPAFIEAQKDMGNATKNAKNPHFKSHYADLSKVIEAVSSALSDNDLAYVQTSEYNPQERNIEVNTRLIHKSGQWIENKISLPLEKQTAQGVGSALTYGRRYGLASICGITQEDDDGNEASKPIDKKLRSKYNQKLLKAGTLKETGIIYNEFITECPNGFESLTGHNAHETFKSLFATHKERIVRIEQDKAEEQRKALESENELNQGFETAITKD